MFKKTCKSGQQNKVAYFKAINTDIVAAKDANDLATAVELDKQSLVEILGASR